MAPAAAPQRFDMAVQMFMGHALTPLSKPLPFFAYPFLVATLCGWAWVHYHEAA